MVPLDALFVSAPSRIDTLANQLGCETVEGPPGIFVRTDEQKMTNVSGVCAAEDIVRMAGNTTLATADGAMAGAAMHRFLVFGDWT